MSEPNCETCTRFWQPALLSDRVDGPRLLLLGGRTWRVTHRDWTRRRCFVEAADDLGGGKARWSSSSFGLSGLSYEMTRSCRRTLLGADPPCSITARAADALAELRAGAVDTVAPDRTIIHRRGDDLRWWTWAGFRTNATLSATLADMVDHGRRATDHYVPLRPTVSHHDWTGALRQAGSAEAIVLPRIDDRAMKGLKFSDVLPQQIAAETLAARLADVRHAAELIREPTGFNGA